MANTLTPIARQTPIEVPHLNVYSDAKVLAANVAETVTVPTFTNQASETKQASRLIISGNADLWLVPLASGDGDIVTNGAFAADTNWTKGTGWSIAAGVAAASSASAELTQEPTALYEGRYYSVVFTVSGFSAGTVTPEIGGTSGTTRSSDATFTETILAGSAADIALVGSSFTGNIDNFSVTPVASVPGGDIATGYAPILIPSGEVREFYVGDIATMSIVAGGSAVASMQWFRS